jgi:hypothetical protein
MFLLWWFKDRVCVWLLSPHTRWFGLCLIQRDEFQFHLHLALMGTNTQHGSTALAPESFDRFCKNFIKGNH